jgi:Cu/Ag efflux protein CusF
MKRWLMAVALAAMVSWPAAAAAQKPISLGEVVSETFTIEAIDYAARVVTLKDKDGNIDEILCGPEVKRFDALKVGDQVTFRYHESVVSSIQRASASAKPPVTGGITRSPGDKPGGTISRQLTATVIIEAIDAKVPSVTIRTDDGRKMSFKVEQAKNLEGYKPGDKVEITYTQALAVSVASPGK